MYATMKKEMMTTKEVAEYLNINEKKVYQLIKERKIPCTKVTGKWTFPRKLIDEWIVSSSRQFIGIKQSKKELNNHLVIMGSNDMTIELLSHEIEREFPEVSVSWANVGSIGGLVALGRGICHVAGCHLFDPATGMYNLPYLHQYLPNTETVVVNLVYREQGLIVKPGNPMGIEGLQDLVRPEIVFINRQKGSGTRILLDFKLKQMGIDPQQIMGYEKEVFTHTEVAIKVLNGTAHVGLGIFSAAKALGLEFIPIAQERYDLVIPQQNLHTKPIKALLHIIRSDHFKKIVEQMGGYETKDSGKLMT